MKARWFVLGGIVFGGLVLWGTKAAAGEEGSEEDDKPDPSGGNLQVRHGVGHVGCSHFELSDMDALEAWVRSNALAFASWLTKGDEVKANPEGLMVDVFKKLFPECEWPPPPSTTFGPENSGWDDLITQVKSQMAAQMDGGDMMTRSSLTIASSLLLALKQQMGSR